MKYHVITALLIILTTINKTVSMDDDANQKYSKLKPYSQHQVCPGAPRKKKHTRETTQVEGKFNCKRKLVFPNPINKKTKNNIVNNTNPIINNQNQTSNPSI